MVTFKTEVQIHSSAPIPEDKIYKRLACQTIQGMPIEALKSIFNFDRIDLNSNETRAKIKANYFSESEVRRIYEMNAAGFIQYIATLKINSKPKYDE